MWGHIIYADRAAPLLWCPMLLQMQTRPSYIAQDLVYRCSIPLYPCGLLSSFLPLFRALNQAGSVLPLTSRLRPLHVSTYVLFAPASEANHHAQGGARR